MQLSDYTTSVTYNSKKERRRLEWFSYVNLQLTFKKLIIKKSLVNKRFLKLLKGSQFSFAFVFAFVESLRKDTIAHVWPQTQYSLWYGENNNDLNIFQSI